MPRYFSLRPLITNSHIGARRIDYPIYGRGEIMPLSLTNPLWHDHCFMARYPFSAEEKWDRPFGWLEDNARENSWMWFEAATLLHLVVKVLLIEKRDTALFRLFWSNFDYDPM